MNKRTIYLMGATIVILLLFVVYLVMQQQTPVPKTSIQTNTTANQNQSASSGNNTSAGNTSGSDTPSQSPDISTAPLSAAQTAKEFYNYYFSSANNPLANGAYKTNKYLTQEFKDDIGASYKNGNTPVFCPQNQRNSIIVGKEEQVFYDNGYLTQVVISDASAGNKDLYRVMLQNLTGSWLIWDINCIK
jgi:hypothetical protein